MIHLVTFTLTPPRDARNLLDELQKSASWMHEVNDTWLLSSIENKWQIWNRLSPFILPQDRVLIVQITSRDQLAGWLSQAGWEWLNYHLALSQLSLPLAPDTGRYPAG